MNLKKLVAGSFFIRISGMFFTLIVGVQLAKLLGPEGYGYYAFAMSLTTILLIPTQLGIPQLIVKEVPRFRQNKSLSSINGIVKWSSSINFTLSLIILLFACFVIYFSIDEEKSYTIIISLISIPILGQIGIKSALLRSYEKLYIGQSLDTIIYPFILSILIFVFSSLKDITPESAMFLRLFAVFLVLILAKVYIYSSDMNYRNAKDAVYNKSSWMNTTIPFALSEGMRVLQGNYIAVVMGFMVEASYLGIYKVAASLLLFLNLPLTVVSSIGSPYISKLYARNDLLALENLIRNLSFILTITTILFLLPFLFFGEDIFTIVFGSEFIGSSKAFLIMGLSTCVVSIFGPSAILLNMCGKGKVVTKISIISLMFLCFISIPMIYMFNVEGAALSYSFGLIFNRIYLYIMAERHFEFKTGILPTFVRT
ncbi:oligosaccharide flippase family protein [Vibrio metschnikovii]|uniref:oligosaccharide flippase family protein n=1 Tax=Vibrio metschnikovii TaxID=28172 RepID=UPI0033283004